MSSDERIDPSQKKLQLKQKMLRRAFEQGCGSAKIEQLSRFCHNVKTTKELTDEEIRNNFRTMAADGAIDLSDELSEQHFNSILRSKRIEDPRIRDLVKEELKTQHQVVKSLRDMGIPESMLPVVSPTLAYLNAIKTIEGQKTVQFDSKSFDRIEQLLAGKPPTNTMN